MQVIEGKGVFGGIAIGNALEISKTQEKIKRIKIQNKDFELKKVDSACQVAKSQLDKLYQEAIQEVGEGNAEIFNIHKMMLEDKDYLESIENIILTESINAEYAVAVTGDNFSKMFLSMEDEYMKERANDVRDITERLLQVMTTKDDKPLVESPAIIFANDLLPSQTVKFDKSKVLAFVTEKGSVNSHTAILARTMNIPAVVGVGEYPENIDERYVIVDGFEGKVYVDPDEKTKKELMEKKRIDDENKQLLEDFKGVDSETLDGKKINIFANIGGLRDVLDVLSNDADGIGLFRSEFLYLENETYPTEEEQLEIYITVARNMAGKKVIIRTLDIGGDKTLPYLPLPEEMNPFLGYRAIRLCLDRKDIFKVQIRALLRASVYGNLCVMFPMISGLEEFQAAKEFVEECRAELHAEGVKTSETTQWGIMVEIPAAAVMADELAKYVDFFSIGTNDLIQYTLAADRMSEKVSYLYNPMHPAVLRLIKMTIDGAHKHGKWVGMCGEMAGDEAAIPTLVEYGLDEFSMSATSILSAKKIILEQE